MSKLLDKVSQNPAETVCCPMCRLILTSDTITNLGLATDAGTSASGDEMELSGECLDPKLPANRGTVSSLLSGIPLTMPDDELSITGGSTVRVGQSTLKDDELNQMLLQARFDFSGVDRELVRSKYVAERCVGTKVTGLLGQVDAMMKKSPMSKCVVFSHFSGVLDVCAAELSSRGIGNVRIDNTTKQHERTDALHEFATNSRVKAFLLTMRDGGVGLSLTAADHCFFMDVAPSCTVVEQAIDRIHRYVCDDCDDSVCA